MANYERINWEDYPSTNTPLDSENLNKMDVAIDAINREVQHVRGLVNNNTDDIELLDNRINAIVALPDGSTKADAELVDGRIGYDNTEYQSLGEAIREQVEDLHDNIAPKYNAGKLYEIGDLCVYGGKLYRRLVKSANVGPAPSGNTDTFWEIVSVSDIVGTHENMVADQFAIGVNYAVGDLVVYRGVLYKSNIAQSSVVKFDSSKWTLVSIEGQLSEINERMDAEGMSDEIKTALLACFANVAWSNGDGQTYIEALSSAMDAAVLIGISINYTQSDVVYVSDTLDSLKSDLVVVAEFDDGTTKTLSARDYTLNGVLIVGTSTITVNYLGFSSTFNVNAQLLIPAEYTEYDYISANGSTTQISTNATGVIKTLDYEDLGHVFLDADFLATNDIGSGNLPIIGVRAQNDWVTCLCVYLTTSATKFVLQTHGSRTLDNPAQVNTVTHLALEQYDESPLIFRVNDTEYECAWTNNNIISAPLYLLNNPVNNVAINYTISNYVQLGQFSVKKESGIVDYYVPVLRTADNVVGIYNATTQQFMTCPDTAKATIGNSACIYKVGNWS